MANMLLHAEEIRQLIAQHKVIQPFTEDSLNAAAYELRVGEKALLVLSPDEGGYIEVDLPRLELEDDLLELAPGQTAVLYSYEIVDIPLDIQGHLFLKASWATRGLYFPGGIVDPGYRGRLFFSVTNLARATLQLALGEPIVKMELVRLARSAPQPYSRETVLELPEHLRPPLPERSVYDPVELSWRLDQLHEKLQGLQEGDRTLLAEDIRKMARERPHLIEFFDEKALKPIAYDLRVGEKVVLALPDGIHQWFLEEGQTVSIPPGAAATIYSLERVNMPMNVKGRLSLRSKFIAQRLNFDGGIVDPGYRGHLFFTVTNLGDSPIEIRYGERFVHLELVQLGKEVEGEQREPTLKIPPDRVPHGPSDEWYTVQELSQLVRELRHKVNRFESARQIVELFFLALIAGVIAAVLLAIILPEGVLSAASNSMMSGLLIAAIFALVVLAAFLAYEKWSKR